MKALAMILIMILMNTNNAQACDGFDEPEVKKLFAFATDVKELIGDDKSYLEMNGQINRKVQQELIAGSMVPIDFRDPKHKLDYYTLGEVRVETVDYDGAPASYMGSAIKIGKSCVMTSAHVLYGSAMQKMSSSGKGQYDGKIQFIRGTGANTETINATVFFQMGKEGVDFKIKNKERKFGGYSDVVILKLNNHSDPYYKKVNVVSPTTLAKGMDLNLGKKMTCQGSPSYKTLKTYGSCKGTDFKWQHENARVFEDDQDGAIGVASNVASGPGMSGGPCYLNESPDQVFALVSNGFHNEDILKPSMPNVWFNGRYIDGNARYLSLFHVLDQRMKKELGFGLDQIAEKCQ